MDRKPIVVSDDVIDSDDLQDFIADVEKLTGQVVTVKMQWVLTCESASVETALDALFGSVVSGAKGKKRAEKKQAEKKIFAATKSPLQIPPVLHEIKSWDVIVNDVSTEKITISEKNRRLAAGEFTEGTILYHPKAGKNKVTGAQGKGQGMEPVEA